VDALHAELAEDLRRLSGEVPEAVAEITVPAYVLDMHGTIRWLNAAALEAFGDRRGDHFLELIPAEGRAFAKMEFAKKISGSVRSTAVEAELIGADGRRYVVDIDSVRLGDDGRLVGVFGLAEIEHPVVETAAREVHLTPRQVDVLRMLAGGSSTDAIARNLHLSKETVRNHVRNLLRALGVHSRLQAVTRARELGIV
jgi:DNA-binding CsgD family transcriptional regulator